MQIENKVTIIIITLMLLFSGCSNSFNFEENTNLGNENFDKTNLNIQNSSYNKNQDNIKDELEFKLNELTNKDLTIYSDEENGIYNIIISDYESKKEICSFNSNIDKGNNKIKLGNNCKISNNKIYHISLSINGKEFSLDILGIVLNSNNNEEIKNIIQNKYLKAYFNGKSVELNWNIYQGDNFKYYKVVHSTTNPDLKYPDDGYLSYITNPNETNYKDKDKFKPGINYYRITTVLKDDSKIHSNVEIINIENNLEVPDIEFNNHLSALDKGDYISLKWNTYEGNNFKYYKVVHSTTNSDLKYPEDGYIKYITNPKETSFNDYKAFKEGMINYYRITTVLKDDSKIHSNVEIISKNPTSEVEEEVEIKDELTPENIDCENEDYDFKISLGEEQIYFGEDGKYNISLDIIEDNKALLTINGVSKSIDLCGVETIGGLEIKVINLVSSNNIAIKGYVEIGVNIVIESQEVIQTDYFNFWEDQISHIYEVSGYKSSGAYACIDEEGVVSTQYEGDFYNSEEIDNSLRIGGCSAEGGEVSITLNVNPSKILKLELQEGFGDRDFGLKIDGIDFGLFKSGSRCNPKEFIFDDKVIQNLTSDRQVRLTLYDGISNSCSGDPQFTYLKVFS